MGTSMPQSHWGTPELPTAFVEAIDRARDAFIERIWHDGYPSGFSDGQGPRWVTLFVQFPHLEATVETLRIAELDHGYSKFLTLSDRRSTAAERPPAYGVRRVHKQCRLQDG